MERNRYRSGAQEALARFGLPWKEITDCSGNTRCSVFRALTNIGHVGVKRYPEEYTISEIESEVQFIRHLMNAGLPVIRPLTSDEGDAFVSLNSGGRAMAYLWVEGEIRKTWSRNDLRAVVRLIGTIHAASRNLCLTRSDRWLWNDTRQCFRRLDPPSDLVDWLERAVQQGRPWEIDDPGLWVCHNDYSTRNFIWPQQEHTPSVIDFTNTILAPREWDLAVLCADLLAYGIRADGRELVDAVSQFYAETRPNPPISMDLRMIELALVQRGVFRVYTTESPRSRAQTWEILRKVRKTIT